MKQGFDRVKATKPDFLMDNPALLFLASATWQRQMLLPPLGDWLMDKS